MRLVLRDLVNGWQSVAALAKVELPARMAFQLARAMRVLEAEYQTYEAQRAALVRKYGEQRGGSIEVSAENLGAFEAELNELLDMELAVDVAPISGELLEDLNTTIKPAVLVGSWFLFD